MDEIEIDESLPGPLGCKYDDSLTELQIQLVVPGIKEKTFTHAANTDVYIKTDSDSVTLLLTVFKMNKKASPPEKITLDKRLFQVKKFPGKILSVDYKLKKDKCVLKVKKAQSGSWANVLAMHALFVSSAKRVPFASPLPTISYAFFSFSRMRLLGILNFVDVNVLLRSMSIHDAKTLIVETYSAVNERIASKIDPVVLIVGVAAGTVTYLNVRRLLRRSDQPIAKRLNGWLFRQLRWLPFVEAKIAKELQKTRKEIEHSIHQYDKEKVFIRELPDGAKSMEEILALAEKYESMNTFDVDNGRVSGAVYTDRLDDHLELLTKIFHKYAYSNPLHPDVFPGCRKMEAEVIRIISNLYHGGNDSCGTMTSGGTESIMLACLAYRNLAFARGIRHPVIVAPVTAHAAFDKAAGYFQMRIVHVPVDDEHKVDVAAMKKAISGDTCVLVGSAPNFPSGTIDNIAEISALGVRYGIPVHVDACLGGFLVPFMEDAGFDVPLFDFRLPGVTSISCDTHKYGNTPKGSSVVLYREPQYLHHQYFCISEWPGGIYATPTLSGSRCGSNIALTWATLLHFGRDVYVQRCHKIVSAAKKLAAEVAKVPGLKTMGRTDVSVVAFQSDEFNIYAVSDKLNKLGWNLNTLQNPASIHFCLTYNQASEEVVNEFVADLTKACEEVRADPKKGGNSKSAAIYGLAAQIPDKSLVEEVAFTFLDACYAMPEKE